MDLERHRVEKDRGAAREFETLKRETAFLENGVAALEAEAAKATKAAEEATKNGGHGDVGGDRCEAVAVRG